MFHGLQYEKNQGGASIFNEVEARIYSINIAENWVIATENWSQWNTMEGLGRESSAGKVYETAFKALQKSYSSSMFQKAVINYQSGSAANTSGIYNNYPLRKPNQSKSLLQHYHVKQR